MTEKRSFCVGNAMITVLFMAVLFLSAFGIRAEAETYRCGDFEYEVLSNGSCEIVSYKGHDSVVTIPAELNGRKVESLGTLYEFQHNVTLKEVIIPDSVKRAKCVFTECPNLKKVVLSENLTSINEYMFSNCGLLEEANIPSKTTKIGHSAFYGCKKLKSITLPKTIRELDDMAFYDCDSVTELILPEGLEVIGQSALGDMGGIKSIKIPSSVIELGNSALRGSAFENDSLVWADLSEYKGNLSWYLFEYQENLKYVVLSADVKEIDARCFTDCDSLKTIYYLGTEEQWEKVDIDSESAEFSKANIVFAKWGENCFDYSQRHITKIVNVVSGVHVYWDACRGREFNYEVFRSTSKTKNYASLGVTASTNFTDTTAQSGKTYYYKVKCVPKSNDTRDYGKNLSYTESEPKKITFVGTPDITTRVNSAYGIRIYWNQIEGAKGYAIYRKGDSANATWARVQTITGNETFTWTDGTTRSDYYNGVIYHYTIRALAGDDLSVLSGCRSTGRTMVRLVTPTMESMKKASATSLSLAWNRNDKATGYEVRFMVGTTVFKTYTYGNNTIIQKTITGLPAGKTYKVQVRAYYKTKNVGTYYSSWSQGKSVTL